MFSAHLRLRILHPDHPRYHRRQHRARVPSLCTSLPRQHLLDSRMCMARGPDACPHALDADERRCHIRWPTHHSILHKLWRTLLWRIPWCGWLQREFANDHCLPVEQCSQQLQEECRERSAICICSYWRHLCKHDFHAERVPNLSHWSVVCSGYAVLANYPVCGHVPSLSEAEPCCR